MAIINLKTFDLSQLPSQEDQDFEFKGSSTPFDELAKKLSKAVSGFANSGGGCFVAGVDGSGNADGGIPLKKGGQPLRDWADRIIASQVAPPPKYDIAILNDSCSRGTIKPGRGVLLVMVEESFVGPHMACDNCYYIRAGAHTEPAKHFIVEAIWAKRHFRKPRLSYVLRLKPENEYVVQLGIVALTDAPAVDVKIDVISSSNLELPPDAFPLEIAAIDRQYPFFADTAVINEVWKTPPSLKLRVQYHGLDNDVFEYEWDIPFARSLPHTVYSPRNEQLVDIQRSLESIAQHLPRRC